MSANSDPDCPGYTPDPQNPPDCQDDLDARPGIPYAESAVRIDSTFSGSYGASEVTDWDRRKRIAQIRALALLRHRCADECNIPILDYPWSDARYPSVVKILGIDSLDEPCKILLDQVWLYRVHPDKPQWWEVIAATTDDCPLTGTTLPDGTWADEGTRAYLDDMLAQMLTSPTKSDRDLSLVLSSALATGQLRYRHLHSAYDSDNELLRIEALYEFPIYSTAAWSA